jgi:hypothetical protein
MDMIKPGWYLDEVDWATAEATTAHIRRIHIAFRIYATPEKGS